MSLDWHKYNRTLLAALDAAYEEDFSDELSSVKLCASLAVSATELQRYMDPLLADGYVEQGFAGLRLSALGKEAFDKATGNTNNSMLRSRLLDLLAARYEQKKDDCVDSEWLASELAVSTNAVCLNLHLFETKDYITAHWYAGAGHPSCLATLTPTGKALHDHPPRQMVFVSHAVIDREMAMLLKTNIERAFPAVEVFVSSAPENQAPGGEWLSDILNALRGATAAIILATEHALDRKWIWFEAGAAWGRQLRPLICCVGKMRKGELPHPFSFHTALNVDVADDYRALLEAVRMATDSSSPQQEPDALGEAKELARLCAEAEVRAKAMADPMYAERRQQVEIQLGKIGKAWKRALHLLALRGEMTEESAISILCEDGLIEDRHANVLFGLIEKSTGFVVPMQSFGNGHVSQRWRLNPAMESVLLEVLANPKVEQQD